MAKSEANFLHLSKTAELQHFVDAVVKY